MDATVSTTKPPYNAAIPPTKVDDLGVIGRAGSDNALRVQARGSRR